MSIAKDLDKVATVSKQVTKMTLVSTKLEWRIKHFQQAMQRYSSDQSISSKTFTFPHPMTVTWRLDVYPHGRSTYNVPYFYLRLVGFQAPVGSLSASINANYKIYLLSSTNEESVVHESIYEFKIDSAVYSSENKEAIDKLIHPDGSLLVICEVESLLPETFSTEPTPNPALLNQKHRLSDYYKEMWKSELFTDCTIEVGAKSFPAHKCILGQWSEVFRKMFSLPTEEAKNGIVEITDFNPEAISAMLEYMYTGVVENEVTEKQALVLELLALADKYAVIPLKEMCEVFLASELTTTNVLQVAMFADRVSAAKLKKACANRLAIDGRAVLQSKEWEDLKSKENDLANELLELMIKDYPGFADVQESKVANTKQKQLEKERKRIAVQYLQFQTFVFALLIYGIVSSLLIMSTKSIFSSKLEWRIGQCITANVYISNSKREKIMSSKKLSEFDGFGGISKQSQLLREKWCMNDFFDSDGSLLVTCEIECLIPGEGFLLELTPNPNLQLIEHIGKMWESQLFTDCTLEAGAKSFPAHKCILGQWSEVFQKMFSLPTEEAESGVVEIRYFSPDAISAMLEYMYSGVVKNEVLASVKLVTELLALADKYAVIPLKETCEVFLASKLTPTNVLRAAVFADRYSAAKLKKACVNRLAMDGRAALQSKSWEYLKSKHKDLADELLELLIKDHPCFADVQEAKVAK